MRASWLVAAELFLLPSAAQAEEWWFVGAGPTAYHRTGAQFVDRHSIRDAEPGHKRLRIRQLISKADAKSFITVDIEKDIDCQKLVTRTISYTTSNDDGDVPGITDFSTSERVIPPFTADEYSWLFACHSQAVLTRKPVKGSLEEFAIKYIAKNPSVTKEPVKPQAAPDLGPQPSPF